MARRIRCPRFFCRSKNCVPVTQQNYKAGKGLAGAIVGDALLGPAWAVVGATAGLTGKKKVKFMCQKCGRVFTKKI